MIRFYSPLIGLFLCVSNTFGQNSPKSMIWPSTVDSVLLVVEQNVTQEMTFEGQAEIHQEIGRNILNSKDQEHLLKKLKQPIAYELGYALLDHSNIFYTIYFSKSATIRIAISTLTRNVLIRNQKEESFKGKISRKFGKYLLKTMIRFDFYNAMNAIGDLEGIQ